VPVTSVCDARSIAKSSIGEDLDFGPSFAEAVGVLAQKIFHRFHTFVELKVVSTQGECHICLLANCVVVQLLLNKPKTSK